MLTLALALPACDGGPGPAPPQPAGCVTDVAPGRHTYTCQGLPTDVQIPAACQRPGCGLILELHGDTGTGPLLDANTDLMALGDALGYIVVAPTGPARGAGPIDGSTWLPEDDDKLVAILRAIAGVFRTDPRRQHLTGFSRGGYVTWRMMCQHADLFASVAPAAAGASYGGACQGVVEVSCPFDPAQPGGVPARPVPVLFMFGQRDVPVPSPCATLIRDQAVAAWSLGAPEVLDGDAQYTHTLWTGPDAGAWLETFEHSYAIVADGTDAAFVGHCIPGSRFSPYEPQYAIPCAPPNAFSWGEEVMRFFIAHPDRP